MFHVHSNSRHRRRGAVIVFVMVMLVTLIGFASLTVDVGALYNTRADLQNAADAAALAGASSLAGDTMLRVRMKKLDSAASVTQALTSRAGQVASELSSFGLKSVILDQDDVKAGWIELTSATSGVESDHPVYQMNAVQVVARRSEGSSNGPLTFFFAPIFGKNTTNVSASATAAFDDRVAGYDPGAGGADLFPITINETTFKNELAKNKDGYEYDAQSDTVSKSIDDMPELDVYPLSNNPGNYGLLNIGVTSNDEPYIANQIENGVTPEDLEKTTGKNALSFYDDDGNSTPVKIPGNTGLKAALENAIKSRIGDVVGIPVYSSVSGTGANVKYNITGIRFVRIMAVSLKSGTKYLWVQPVSYSGRGLVIDPNAPSSGGMAGRVVLVR